MTKKKNYIAVFCPNGVFVGFEKSINKSTGIRTVTGMWFAEDSKGRLKQTSEKVEDEFFGDRFRYQRLLTEKSLENTINALSSLKKSNITVESVERLFSENSQ